MILAVDTSLPLMSVALVEGGRLVGALSIEAKESRNEKLLPAVDWLLAETGTARAALEMLAVTRGPGSFTGVRIGLATMQGLAVALGRPLCTLSTHEAIAGDEPGRTLVYGDAGRGEYYVSGFDRGGEVLAPELATPGRLEELRREFERQIEVSDFIARDNVAVSAARRAAALRAVGELEGHVDVTPIYVRLAEAEVRLRERTSAG